MPSIIGAVSKRGTEIGLAFSGGTTNAGLPAARAGTTGGGVVAGELEGDGLSEGAGVELVSGEGAGVGVAPADVTLFGVWASTGDKLQTTRMESKNNFIKLCVLRTRNLMTSLV